MIVSLEPEMILSDISSDISSDILMDNFTLQPHFFSSAIKGSKKASKPVSFGCDMLYIAKNTEITKERKRR
jgi:hypothetical protein